MSAPGARPPLETTVARVLKAGTYAAMALVAVGVVLMAIESRSPLDVAPALDPGRLFEDVLALRPAGFLWLGVVVILATPPARVLIAFSGYLRSGEREMALVAVLILIVIALGVVAGTSGS